MSLWRDTCDWLCGYPFEVPRPEAVFEFVRWRGKALTRPPTFGHPHVSSEFVFNRLLTAR
jgi:2-polyprenyl-6-hydroxyphenyl methylase/3-demethylubiquinone-9 3-methyltransferase